MPIDTSIYRTQQPVQIQTPNPLDMITAAARLEDVRAQADQRRLAGEKARQQAIDEAQVRSVMAGVGGDVDAGIAKLYSVNPRAAASLEEQVGKARKEHVEALKTNLANQNTQLDHYLKVWGLVGDQPSLDAIRPMFAKTFPELDKVLPTEYGDGSAVQRVSDLALSRKEQLEQKQNVVKLFADGKMNEAISQGLSQTNSPEEWNTFKTGMKAMGAPDAMLATYGDFSPENKARAAQLGITPAKREELAGQAATRAQTEAHQTTQEGQAAATLAQTATRDTQAHADRMAALAVARERLKKTAGGRPVTSADARRISEYNDSRTELATLADTVSTEGATGVSAQIGVKLPNWVTDVTGWGIDAKKKQAVIDRVKQVIGKTLEGGVLRKEDEIKYEKILPTISDPAALVTSKLQGLDAMIAQKRQDQLDALTDANYDVSNFAARAARPPLSERAGGAAGGAGRVRVVGPNGQTGTVPAGTTLPPGWRTP